jgi:hypothetical protein
MSEYKRGCYRQYGSPVYPYQHNHPFSSPHIASSAFESTFVIYAQGPQAAWNQNCGPLMAFQEAEPCLVAAMACLVEVVGAYLTSSWK